MHRAERRATQLRCLPESARADRLRSCRRPRRAHDLGPDLRLHPGAPRGDREGDRVDPGPDPRRHTRSCSWSTTRQSWKRSAGSAGRRSRRSPTGRNRGSPAPATPASPSAAARWSPSSTTTRSPHQTGSSASATPTPIRACWGQGVRSTRPGRRESRAGSRPSSTGSSAARTRACQASARRCATWSAPTCPSAAMSSARSAAFATSWAGSARSPPAARRPTSASGSASAGRTGRSSTTRRPRSITSCPGAVRTLRYFTSRCRGEGRSKAILSGLVGSQSGLEAERAYVRRTLPLGFLRGLGETLRGRPSGAARSAMLVVGLLTTTRGYLSASGERRRLSRLREASEPEQVGTPRVLMVTPRSPLSQGGVERHVMEVSRSVRRRGGERRGALHRAGRPHPGRGAARRRHDPHRARLASQSRLVPGAADLARDGAPALGRRPRPVLPHVRGAVGDAAGADAARPLRRHLPRRRPLLRVPQQGSRPAAQAAAAAAEASRPADRGRPLRDRGVRRRAGPAGGEVHPDPERHRPRLLRSRNLQRAARGPA